MMGYWQVLLIISFVTIEYTVFADFIRDNLVDDVPKFMRNPDEVNKTIFEVEQLISKNSDLPRLTRGEILSLLENITREDELKTRRPPTASKPKSNNKENVVVVLPVNAVPNTHIDNFYQTPAPPPPRHQIFETSSEFENLVTLQKSPSKETTNPMLHTSTTDSIIQLHSFTDFTTTRSPLEFGLPMSIKKNPKNPSNSIFQSGTPSTLAPDIEEVLKTLGLEKGLSATHSSDPTPTFQIPNVHDLEPIVPSIDPNSYSRFKLIPTKTKTSKDKEINSEMKDFLASFGLLPDQKNQPSRSEKSMQGFSKSDKSKSKIQNKTDENILIKDNKSSNNKSKMNVLSDDMKKVLENMGLLDFKNGSSNSGEYIFNPVVQTTILDQAKEVNKITKVLDGIRELSKDNKFDNLSQEEIRAHLDNITSQVLTGPDDNGSEEIDIGSFEPDESPKKGTIGFNNKNVPDPLNEVNNSLLSDKNEFKRQQPSDITSSTELSTTSDSEIVTTDVSETTTSAVKDSTTETEIVNSKPEDSSTVVPDAKAEDTSPSLTDLADSFGGGETASEEPSPEALPSPRPNGLYFYVDWNTFLNVGSEDTKNRVNLRFAPKVGNPRLFLPVSVP